MWSLTHSLEHCVATALQQQGQQQSPKQVHVTNKPVLNKRCVLVLISCVHVRRCLHSMRWHFSMTIADQVKSMQLWVIEAFLCSSWKTVPYCTCSASWNLTGTREYLHCNQLRLWEVQPLGTVVSGTSAKRGSAEPTFYKSTHRECIQANSILDLKCHLMEFEY